MRNLFEVSGKGELARQTLEQVKKNPRRTAAAAAAAQVVVVGVPCGVSDGNISPAMHHHARARAMQSETVATAADGQSKFIAASRAARNGASNR